MAILHPREYAFAFSLNKQSDIETAIANAQINKLRDLRSFAPILERHNNITDRSNYGKRHPHATYVTTVQKWYELRPQERSASNIELAHALAMVMGNVSTVQADSASEPNEYTHTFTFQDPRDNKEVVYTSFGEEFGVEEKQLYSGGWINSLTLIGNRDDHVVLSYEGGAREMAAGTFDVPAITTASFLQTLYGTLSFGAADSISAVSATVLSWNLTINQNAEPLWLMGNPSGEEQLISKVLVGDQIYSGQVVFLLDASYRDNFRNETTVEFEIVAKSPGTIDSNAHTMTAKLHNLRISDEDIVEEGQTIGLVVNFSEDTTLKTEADPYLSVDLLTNIDTTELLVAA